MPPMSQRLCLLLLAAGLAAGCAGLQPLPRSSGRTCDRSGGLDAFWRCVEAGSPPPRTAESAFRSTYRVVAGDLRRKRLDQRPGPACTPRPPDLLATPGRRFVAVAETLPGAVAPLHAYFHPGDAGQPVVVVVHGLFDSKASRYVMLAARALAAHGLGVLVPDMRWHGCLLTEEPRWLPTLGLDESGDLVAWSRWLGQGQATRGRPVGVLGFSLGALDVIHALARPEAPELFAAGGIAVSPPGDLERSLGRLGREAFFLDEGASVLFHRSFRSFLTRRIAAQRIPLPTAGEGCRRGGGTGVGEEDVFYRLLCYVASRRGGEGPAALLRRAEPAPAIRAARVPLLVLTTSDDPIFSEAAAAALTAAAAGNPLVRVLETPHGGHVGQIGLHPAWLAELLGRFFGAPQEKSAR